MSKIGEAILEMQDLGLEPTQDNLKVYVEHKKQEAERCKKKKEEYKEKGSN